MAVLLPGIRLLAPLLVLGCTTSAAAEMAGGLASAKSSPGSTSGLVSLLSPFGKLDESSWADGPSYTTCNM